MKIHQLVSFFSVSTLTLAATFISNSPALSQKPTFVCGTDENGFPATIVQSPQHGDKTIIVWNSGHFEASGYSDRRRCNEVTKKFQDFYDKGTLKHLVNGTNNGQAIICAIPSKNTPCNSDTQLYTLKSKKEAHEKLQRLRDIRSSASSRPMYESTGRVYVDFEDFLKGTAKKESDTNPELSSIKPENSESSLNNNFLF